MPERMNRTLTHRGPDDAGYFVDGRIALAMRRLSIIDLEGGSQPIANEDGTVRVVYNGEIYNYLELRSDLESRGHRFETQSDTEVIVHLYEEYGEDCVTRLAGMFAFALWDGRGQRLLLGRDRLGIKPLFYSWEPGRRLVFGSEIKAILAAGVDREPDRQALYDYLSLMYVPTPATSYKAIRKLPPGSILTCSESGMEIREYWDLPLPESGNENLLPKDVDSTILERIEAAVRRHMIADVPVGALLSGGLDSTTVTAVMRRELGIPVKTFTAGFAHASYDESADARLVADTLATDHIEQIVQPDMIPSIEGLLAHFDEPFADYSAIPTYLVSKLASEHLKVVLTGDGGDEVFAGYPTHTAYRAARLFRLIPRVVRRNLIDPLVMAMPTSMERISLDYMAKRFVRGVDLPLGQGHYWWKVIFSEQDKKKLCSPDWIDTGMEDTYRVFDRYFRKAGHAHPLNQLLYVDTKTFLLDDNLTKVDRMTMAVSLEARVPLLDHELVEFVARLPPSAKSRGFQTKRLLRNAVRGLLPKSIRKGKKRGFTPPLPHWIRNELREFMTESLAPEKIRETGLLNPEYVTGLLEDHFRGKVDNNRQLWTVLALVNWSP